MGKVLVGQDERGESPPLLDHGGLPAKGRGQEIGRTRRPGCMSVSFLERLLNCRAGHVPGSPALLWPMCLIGGQNPQESGAKKIRHTRRMLLARALEAASDPKG